MQIKDAGLARKAFEEVVDQAAAKPASYEHHDAHVLRALLEYSVTWIDQAADALEGQPVALGIVVWEDIEGHERFAIEAGRAGDFLKYRLTEDGHAYTSGTPDGSGPASDPVCFDVVEPNLMDVDVPALLETAAANIKHGRDSLADVIAALQQAAAKLRTRRPR